MKVESATKFSKKRVAVVLAAAFLLHFRFSELERTTNVKNFAVTVISEMLLPPRSPYKWRYKEEVIGKKTAKSLL